MPDPPTASARALSPIPKAGPSQAQESESTGAPQIAQSTALVPFSDEPSAHALRIASIQERIQEQSPVSDNMFNLEDELSIISSKI